MQNLLAIALQSMKDTKIWLLPLRIITSMIIMFRPALLERKSTFFLIMRSSTGIWTKKWGRKDTTIVIRFWRWSAKWLGLCRIHTCWILRIWSKSFPGSENSIECCLDPAKKQGTYFSEAIIVPTLHSNSLTTFIFISTIWSCLCLGCRLKNMKK